MNADMKWYALQISLPKQLESASNCSLTFPVRVYRHLTACCCLQTVFQSEGLMPPGTRQQVKFSQARLLQFGLGHPCRARYQTIARS